MAIAQPCLEAKEQSRDDKADSALNRGSPSESSVLSIQWDSEHLHKRISWLCCLALLFMQSGLYRHKLQANHWCSWHLSWLISDPAGHLILCGAHSGMWDCIPSELHARWAWWCKSQLSPRNVISLVGLLCSLLLTLSCLFASLFVFRLSLILLHRWPGH